MEKITSLNQYKDTKINKKIINDIDNIILILEKSQQALTFFKQYKPIQEILSIMETNKILFKLKKAQYEKNSIEHPNKK